jgi:beta-lactamase class A
MCHGFRAAVGYKVGQDYSNMDTVLMKFILQHTKTSLIIGSLLVLIVGMSIGSLLSETKMLTCSRYELLNTDVVCGSPDVIAKTGYAKTRQEIVQFIEAMKTSGEVQGTAVYFRDLKHGPTFGINESANFSPASLLKLPLAIVYLRAAESEPALLSNIIEYDGTSTVTGQSVQPEQTAQVGKPYTIEELLELMLVYSDNASYEILEQFVLEFPERRTLRRDTFQELGLIDPQSRSEETITVRGYASIFTMLHNASYLNLAFSEKILGWLATSYYDRGLVAGVPEGTTVASKFGERLYDDGTKQLHDCGIVYYPGNPYLLCVMSQGTDWDALAETIATISRMVYDEVDSRRL